MLDTAFSLFDTFKKTNLKNNLSEIELQALNSLLQNEDITIQKAEKGNTIVVIDIVAIVVIDKKNDLLFFIKKKDLGKLLNPYMKKVVLLKVNI